MMTSVAHIPIRPGLALPGDQVFDLILHGLRTGKGALADARRKAISYMAGFSDAAEIDVLDSIFGDHATIQLYTAPTYLALVTVAVTETMTGSTITEAAYTGYARKSISAADMGPAAAGAKSNTVQQQFAACTAGSATVIGWSLCTASTAGQVIVYGTATSTVISTTQTPATVGVGSLSVTLD